MASPSIPATVNEVNTVNAHVENNIQHGEKDKGQVNENVIKRKRQKTPTVWNDFEEIELLGGLKKVVCKYCKEKLGIGMKKLQLMAY